jgi:hypothetical protein
MIISPFCLIFLLYALYNYISRLRKIQYSQSTSYHDKCGPIFLVLVLLITLITVLILQFSTLIDFTYVIKNSNECHLIKEKFQFFSPSGIVKQNDFIYVPGIIFI